jgi:hypothetical protein
MNVDLIGTHQSLGKRLEQPLGVMPVSGDPMAIEQTGMPEDECPGADGAVPLGPGGRVSQPCGDPLVLAVVGAGAARYQQ